MLGQALRRRPRMLRERVTFLRADAAHLPFASQGLDACAGHSFLYLVADRTAVLGEARRVLKPGGRLVLMEPNARAASVSQVLAISRDPRHLVSASLWRPFSRLHGRFSPASLVATLERAGFEVCGAEETLGGLGVLGWGTSPEK
jgi:ubiquinone/menaquinone biosynthesis C-methylase UbiE